MATDTAESRTTIGAGSRITVWLGLSLAGALALGSMQVQRLSTLEKEVSELRTDMRDVRDILMKEFRATKNERENP